MVTNYFYKEINKLINSYKELSLIEKYNFINSLKNNDWIIFFNESTLKDEYIFAIKKSDILFRCNEDKSEIHLNDKNVLFIYFFYSYVHRKYDFNENIDSILEFNYIKTIVSQNLDTVKLVKANNFLSYIFEKKYKEEIIN